MRTEETDQTGQMPRMIWVFTGRTLTLLVLSCCGSNVDFYGTGIPFQMLREQNYTFDIAYTSVLKRAIKTLYLVQEELDLHWIPVVRHWRLNERHYGGLQGLNKAETAAKHGDAQVKVSAVIITWKL